MRTLTLAAAFLAAAIGLAFQPPAARADLYYPPTYYGPAAGYFGSPWYSYTPGFYVRPAYSYTPGYPYGYGANAHFHFAPGFRYQWHDHAWNPHLGGWGYGVGYPR